MTHDHCMKLAALGLWSDVLAHLRDRRDNGNMDVDAVHGGTGRTLLTLATTSCSPWMPSFAATCALVGLLQAGASVDGYDVYGTPLHHACARAAPDRAAVLLAWGANPCAVTTDGQSTVALCMKGGEDVGALACTALLVDACASGRRRWNWQRDVSTATACGRGDVADAILCRVHWSPARCQWMWLCVKARARTPSRGVPGSSQCLRGQGECGAVHGVQGAHGPQDNERVLAGPEGG